MPSPPRPRPPADWHPPFGLSGRCPGRHTAPSPASDRVTHAAQRRGSDPSVRVFSLPLCPAVSRPGHACAEVRCESAPSTRHVHLGAGPTRPLCLVTRPTGHRTSHSPDRAHAAPEADRLQSALMRSDARLAVRSSYEMDDAVTRPAVLSFRAALRLSDRSPLPPATDHRFWGAVEECCVRKPPAGRSRKTSSQARGGCRRGAHSGWVPLRTAAAAREATRPEPHEH